MIKISSSELIKFSIFTDGFLQGVKLRGMFWVAFCSLRCEEIILLLFVLSQTNYIILKLLERLIYSRVFFFGAIKDTFLVQLKDAHFLSKNFIFFVKGDFQILQPNQNILDACVNLLWSRFDVHVRKCTLELHSFLFLVDIVLHVMQPLFRFVKKFS